MRIGIFDPYLDDCGGGEKYMMTIANVLSKEHQVDVFWDTPTDLQKVSERFNLDLKKVTLVKNIFTTNVSIVSRMKESSKYDTIIILSDGSLPLLLSKKLLVHIQRPIEIGRFSLIGKVKKARVSSFFCNSEFTKSFIDSQFHIEAGVVYPPVDLHPKKVKKENIILHVGRYRVFDKTVGVGDFKKQNIMIDSFKEMVDHGLKGWKFVLCVSVLDKDKADFESLVKKTKDYPVEFEINKSNEELWEFYSKAKIYWHASGYGEDLKKYPERAEHFGISTVEAMGAGAVPVVIDAGGQSEIVTDSGNGMLWKTIPELIEETLILINSKDLLGELSKAAQKRSKDFSLSEFEKHINKLINV